MATSRDDLAAVDQAYRSQGVMLPGGTRISGLGFTAHAIERFGQRAGLGTTSRMIVEPIIRDLVAQEGRVVRERPPWARSRSHADLYLQIGEWILLIAQPDRQSNGAYSVVTVVNGSEDYTWRVALRRGDICTPPPPWLGRVRRRRVGTLGSVAAVALGDYGEHATGGFLSAVHAAHAARVARAQAEYERAIIAWIASDRR
jgi:hypothetical protein